jgi:hypothetical protein
MDPTIAVMGGVLIVAIAIVLVAAKVGINYGRRRSQSPGRELKAISRHQSRQREGTGVSPD